MLGAMDGGAGGAGRRRARSGAGAAARRTRGTPPPRGLHTAGSAAPAASRRPRPARPSTQPCSALPPPACSPRPCRASHTSRTWLWLARMAAFSSLAVFWRWATSISSPSGEARGSSNTSSATVRSATRDGTGCRAQCATAGWAGGPHVPAGTDAAGGAADAGGIAAASQLQHPCLRHSSIADAAGGLPPCCQAPTPHLSPSPSAHPAPPAAPDGPPPVAPGTPVARQRGRQAGGTRGPVERLLAGSQRSLWLAAQPCVMSWMQAPCCQRQARLRKLQRLRQLAAAYELDEALLLQVEEEALLALQDLRVQVVHALDGLPNGRQCEKRRRPKMGGPLSAVQAGSQSAQRSPPRPTPAPPRPAAAPAPRPRSAPPCGCPFGR